MPKDNNSEIPEMNLDMKYSTNAPLVPETTSEVKKEMDKTKKELDKLKKFILKKYPFTQSLSILPPQLLKFFIEEEEIPKETETLTQLYMIIPEKEFKSIPKIKQEVVKEIEKNNQKIWIQIKTPVDVWENCLDSKFELTNAIAMSFPLYDTGYLGALRVSEIHKSLVLQKFEKYVVSYVIGGSLVRGEAIETSDVDVFVIINDTDVKRMPRLELKERLRSIIYKYIDEATALAGVKNRLEPQIYLLTEFWDSVKDAHPVMFTFIRDGVPLYDRGTFMPWKALLKMGKLKPSPEAIDMFMSSGDRTLERANRALMDILIQDIYWGVMTPTQGLLMLYGLAPPNVKETVKEMKRIFVDKEKMLELKYYKILEEVAIKYYKGYEHGKVKKVSGKEIDKLMKNTEDYLKRLKELRKEIESRTQKKTIEEIYQDVFNLLKNIVGKKSQEKTIEEFDKNFVKKGRFPKQYLKFVKNLVEVREDMKKNKAKTTQINDARRESSILINGLVEFNQRCELVSLEKGRMKIKYGKDKIAELVTYQGITYLIQDKEVSKITNKLEKSDVQELTRALEKQNQSEEILVNPKVFEVLKKELGNFEIIF